MAELIDPVSMSGGPIEQPQEGSGWAEGTTKEFTINGKIHTYRRLVTDEELGTVGTQAVFCGSRKET